jgi:hypothetical protein
MYAILLIPVVLYSVFFVLKWSILLAPLTLPFSVVASAIRNAFSPVKYEQYKKLVEKVEKLEEKTSQKGEWSASLKDDTLDISKN